MKPIGRCAPIRTLENHKAVFESSKRLVKNSSGNQAVSPLPVKVDSHLDIYEFNEKLFSGPDPKENPRVSFATTSVYENTSPKPCSGVHGNIRSDVLNGTAHAPFRNDFQEQQTNSAPNCRIVSDICPRTCSNGENICNAPIAKIGSLKISFDPQHPPVNKMNDRTIVKRIEENAKNYSIGVENELKTNFLDSRHDNIVGHLAVENFNNGVMPCLINRPITRAETIQLHKEMVENHPEKMPDTPIDQSQCNQTSCEKPPRLILSSIADVPSTDRKNQATQPQTQNTNQAKITLNGGKIVRKK